MTDEAQTNSDSQSDGALVTFVIGPIGDKHAKPGTVERRRYELGIQTLEKIVQPACLEAGIAKPIRADQVSAAGEITEQTFRLVRDADVVIADLTDGNPNVMYELGLRHTKDKLTVQIGEHERLPFDVSTIRTIKFTRSEGGYIDAKNDLRKALEEGIAGSFDPVTATRLWNEESSDSPAVVAADAIENELLAEGEDDEPGYLEALVESEEAFPRIVTTMEEIGEVTRVIGTVATQGTAEISESDRQQKGARGRLVAAILFAERLDEPISRLEELGSSYRADVYKLEPAMTSMLDLVESGTYQPEDRADIVVGLRAFAGLGDAVREAMPGIEGFRESVEGISSMARPIRVRTRKLIPILDGIVQTSKRFEEWGERAERLLKSIPEDQ